MKATVKKIANAIIQFIGPITTDLKRIKELEVAPGQPPIMQCKPSNFPSLPHNLQLQYAKAIERPNKVVYYCSDVSVSWHGLVMRGLELFKPSLPYPEAWYEFSGTYLLRQWVTTVTRPEFLSSLEVALVYDFWSVNNYYHWLIDVLPRLLILKQLHPNCIILLPEGASDYMRLSVGALGFTKFHFIPKNRILTGIDIIMPGHVAAVGRQDSLLLAQVREQLVNTFASAKTSSVSKRRVFASRGTQKTRRLLNEEEIFPLLKRYDIEIVIFDKMTLPQQIQLMQTVDLFIGVHGANMTNLLFLSPDASVIELMDSQHPNLCYSNMATNLSFVYKIVPCEGIIQANTHENNYDLRVNSEVLEQVITQSI
jgi:hypothetical protein